MGLPSEGSNSFPPVEPGAAILSFILLMIFMVIFAFIISVIICKWIGNAINLPWIFVLLTFSLLGPVYIVLAALRIDVGKVITPFQTRIKTENNSSKTLTQTS